MDNFSRFFDHTLLKPDAVKADIRALCEEAAEYGFCSVCVNSCHVNYARTLLDEAGRNDIKIASVVGFPLGAMSTEAKCFEARTACTDGAEEIDMVMNIGAVKEGDYEFAFNDIKAVTETAHSQGALIKVILETGLLSDEEIVKATELAISAGADFVKTSTGFLAGGADADKIRLMKKAGAGRIKVKASGGIRTLADAEKMIEAGADRIGASASVKIMKEYYQTK